MEKRSGRESIKRIGYINIIPFIRYIKHIFCIYLQNLIFFLTDIAKYAIFIMVLAKYQNKK